MSRIPTGVATFSISEIFWASRDARGTPRRRMPTNTSPSFPLLRSTISCARRTSVRSISDEDINCDFSRTPTFAPGAPAVSGFFIFPPARIIAFRQVVGGMSHRGGKKQQNYFYGIPAGNVIGYAPRHLKVGTFRPRQEIL